MMYHACHLHAIILVNAIVSLESRHSKDRSLDAACWRRMKQWSWKIRSVEDITISLIRRVKRLIFKRTGSRVPQAPKASFVLMVISAR